MTFLTISSPGCLLRIPLCRVSRYGLAALLFLGLCACAPRGIVPDPVAPQGRNVILFIGDGMQLHHEIAYSRYATGGDFGLRWESFPYNGSVSTWDVTVYNAHAASLGATEYDPEIFDPRIGYDPSLGGANRHSLDTSGSDAYFLKTSFATDSASAATAMATGAKTDGGKIAWGSKGSGDLPLTTIAELARQERGAGIGIITTVPFNHATPAAFVAHNRSRLNYSTRAEETGIAEEIVRSTRPDVVIGGGHPDYEKRFVSRVLLDELRTSEDYLLIERQAGIGAAAALQDGARLAASSGRKLFGLFGGAGGNFESPVVVHAPGSPKVTTATNENPTLAQAVTAALEVLSIHESGFFLMAEQGDLDWVNHANDFEGMLGTMHDLHEAVLAAISFVERPGNGIDWSNTLLIVTSDHGNGFMRLQAPMSKGELPAPSEIVKTGETPPPGTTPKVTYGTHRHTNELVSLYATGAGHELFKKHEGAWYPGAAIIDNTAIFKVMKEFILGGKP